MTNNVLNPLVRQTVALVIEGPGGSGQGSGILVSLAGLGLKEGATIPRAKGPDMVLKNDDVLIVTCAHCIPGGIRAMPVELYNGERAIADALVVDNRADVALMKIRDFEWDSANSFANAHDLAPVKVGKSSQVSQGARILTVGAPLMADYRFSLHSGVISKTKAYNPLSILPTFVIDAQINPGNSGGLLALEETGEWIGMNSSGLFGAGGGNRGLNHALRVGEIRFWIKRMVVHKKVVRDGITSMMFLQLGELVKKKLGLKTPYGAFIAAIADDDPGVGQVLQRTDVIQRIKIKRDAKDAAGNVSYKVHKVIEVETPQDCVYGFQRAAGLHVDIDIWRSGATQTVSCKVPIELMPFSNQASFDPFGMELQTYRGNKGVQVANIHPQCPLYGALDRHDVITGVEDPNDPTSILPVPDSDTFYKLAQAHNGKPFWIEREDLKIILPLYDVRQNPQHLSKVLGIEMEPDLYEDEGGDFYDHLMNHPQN